MSEMTHLLSAKCSTMDLEDIQILLIHSQQNVIGLVYKTNDILKYIILMSIKIYDR